MVSIIFPKQIPAFKKDANFLKLVRQLEDRIEQKYICQELIKNLTAISDAYRKPIKPSTDNRLPDELLKVLTDFIEDDVTHPLDVTREAIWKMKRLHGTLFVLSFLSPALLTSLESLFTGTVVKYIQMFGGDRREALDAREVFSGDPDTFKAHKSIKTLRNKRYAHKEKSDDRHELYFHITDNGEPLIDPSAPHQQLEFHHTTCSALIKCLTSTTIFLDKDIKKRSDSLIANLSGEQIKVLKEQWKDAVEGGLTKPTVYKPINWKKFPPTDENS